MEPRSTVIALFGSSVPVWILASLAGIVLALAIRELLVVTGLQRELPAAPLFHSAVALICGILAYVLWIGGYR